MSNKKAILVECYRKSILTIICCLQECISRKLDQRQSSQDISQVSDMDCKAYPSASQSLSLFLLNEVMYCVFSEI